MGLMMQLRVTVSNRHSLSVSFAALAVGSVLMATPAAAGGGDLAAGVLGGLAA